MRALSLRLIVLTLVGTVAAMNGAHFVVGAQAPPPYVAARDPVVGTWRLKGIAVAVELLEVWSEAACSRDFPPPRASSPEPLP